MEVVVGVVDSGRVPKEGWKGGEGWIMGRLVGFFRLAATARLSGPGMAFPSVGPAWLPRDGTGWLLLLAVALLPTTPALSLGVGHIPGS